MDGNLTIGVLALQGGFAKHCELLAQLNVPTIEVRTASDLNRCDGLILPGGESTTILKLIEENALLSPLISFAKTRPLFGTCAGLILMANHLDCLDIKVERNAYGRQIASFQTELKWGSKTLTALFIRAPRIRSYSPDVKVLITYQDEPVCVQQNHHMACTFHPELTNDPTIHQGYIQICKKKQSLLQPLKTTPTKSFHKI